MMKDMYDDGDESTKKLIGGCRAAGCGVVSYRYIPMWHIVPAPRSRPRHAVAVIVGV